MEPALIGVALVLTLLVGLLLGPPARHDARPPPGLILCLLAAAACLVLLGLAVL